MDPVDPDHLRSFSQLMENRYLMPLIMDYKEVLHGMRAGEFTPKQHARLRVYLETGGRHAGLMAGIVACNYAQPGSLVYEWGLETLRNKIAEIFTNRKVTIMPYLFAAFTLANLAGRPAAQQAVKYEIDVWDAVRKTIGSLPGLHP